MRVSFDGSLPHINVNLLTVNCHLYDTISSFYIYQGDIPIYDIYPCYNQSSVYFLLCIMVVL